MDGPSLQPLEFKAPNEFIAWGATGVIYGIDDARILKEYATSDDPESKIERRAYERLGSHPFIATYLGATEGGSIVIERGECLQQLLQRNDAGNFPLHQRLCWAKQ